MGEFWEKLWPNVRINSGYIKYEVWNFPTNYAEIHKGDSMYVYLLGII